MIERIPLRGAWLAMACLLLAAFQAVAADYPAPRQGTWVVRDFKFQNGQVLPELKLAYSTVGEPAGEPVLVLHGTTGSAASMLTPAFRFSVDCRLWCGARPALTPTWDLTRPDGLD